MALISLQEAKDFLDVFISSDDDKLQILLNGAIDEAVRFINQETPEDYEEWLLTSENPYVTSENPTGVPPSFVVGALLLLQANYQASPMEIETLRKAAEVKLYPLRINLGI